MKEKTSIWVLLAVLCFALVVGYAITLSEEKQPADVPTSTTTLALPDDLCNIKGLIWLNKKCD